MKLIESEEGQAVMWITVPVYIARLIGREGKEFGSIVLNVTGHYFTSS